MNFSDKISIDRPRTLVWQSFADPAGWATWWGGNLKRIDPGWEVGAKLVWELGYPSKIAEFIAEERVTLASSSNVRTTFLFADTGDGKTAVTYGEDYAGASVSVTDPARRQAECRSVVTGLKRYVESTTKPDKASAPSAEPTIQPPAATPSSGERASRPGHASSRAYPIVIVGLLVAGGLLYRHDANTRAELSARLQALQSFSANISAKQRTDAEALENTRIEVKSLQDERAALQLKLRSEVPVKVVAVMTAMDSAKAPSPVPAVAVTAAKMALNDAVKQGLISLTITGLDGGERVRLLAKKRTAKPLILTIGSDLTIIADKVWLLSDKAIEMDLSTNDEAAVVVAQAGMRKIMSGSMTIEYQTAN
jgi:hypothetical protein